MRNPRVFLFDEPLSNLDAQLRDEMRREIKRLHQEIATTMIYVTHDQVEAMTLADRIVLLRDGVIEQQGAPLELFEKPVTLFVAGFLGSPRMNFINGRLERAADAALVKLSNGGPSLALPAAALVRARRRQGHPRLSPGTRGRASAGPPADGHARVESTIELVQPTARAATRLSDWRVSRPWPSFKPMTGRAGERIHVDINLGAPPFRSGTGKAFKGSRR